MPKYVDETGLARFWGNIKDQIGSVSQEQVDAWLDEHPEATTTVQDGAITTAKLAGEATAYLTNPAFGKIDTTTVAGYINASGGLSSDDVTVSTGYFQVSEGVVVRFIGVLTPTWEPWCAIAYYDKNKTFISRNVFFAYGAKYYVNSSLTTPANACYARLSYRIHEGWSFSYYYEPETYGYATAKGVTEDNFVLGSLTNGELVPSAANRISMVNTAIYDKDILIVTNNGYRIGVQTFVDGVFSQDLYWHTGFYTIPANTEFKLAVAKETEDNSMADVHTFFSQLMVTEPYSDDPQYVRGSMSSGALTSNSNRLVTASRYKFDKMCKIVAADGYMFAPHEYRNDSFYYDYYWRSTWYMPAGAEFRLVIKTTSDTLVPKGETYYTIELCEDEPVNSNFPCINHRGWYLAPENTMEAFELSKQVGFNYIETDIALTSDGVPVLLHDDTINRTARNLDYSSISSTIQIADITYEQALGYTFNCGLNYFRQYMKIPTLAELMEFCKFNAIHAYLELKTSAAYTDGQLENIVNIVKSYGMQDNVTWISFNTIYLQKVRGFYSGARVGYVQTSITDEYVSFVSTLGNNAFLDVDMSAITDAGVQKCISNDVVLEAWTTSDIGDFSSINPYVSRLTNNIYHS